MRLPISKTKIFSDRQQSGLILSQMTNSSLQPRSRKKLKTFFCAMKSPFVCH
jgi:hypothetical protein